MTHPQHARTISELMAWLGPTARLRGNPDVTFHTIQSLFEAGPGALTWARAELQDRDTLIAQSAASVVICDPGTSIPDAALERKSLVLVPRPEVGFLRALKGMYPAPPSVPGPHPTAIVHPDAEIAPDVSIGPFTVVGRCRIGAGSTVGPFTMIHDGAQIGANVHIREHCSIGGQGFGHILNEHGELENMPHIGSVVIEDDVELFPYVNVDRATLGRTLIRRGARIDHYAHIGHNTTVGVNALVTAHVVMAGGSQVGDHAFIGLNVMIRDRCRVGAHAVVGMSAVVTRDIPDGETWIGAPAAPMKRRPKPG